MPRQRPSLLVRSDWPGEKAGARHRGWGEDEDHNGVLPALCFGNGSEKRSFPLGGVVVRNQDWHGRSFVLLPRVKDEVS